MRNLVVSPDPRLRQPCRQVDKIDKFVEELVEEMLAFLKGTAHGLAAPQLGELLNVFVVAIDTTEATTDAEPSYNTRVLINPTIVKEVGVQAMTESCLSLPGKEFLVLRPKIIKVKGVDLRGRESAIKGHDLLARILKHEMDHLSGILVEDVALRRL